ncbi:heavy metal sensor histidine kinase [Acinetobacter sichuanensis]|uniref:heavy metal sensor histidine kinase n=1 Tax=Acinetobacter sichuanensis TaxID=2136183 RepID=UPI00280EF796|nr:heavy metal sensor histidine kinase [Acinetobacter sichuanensis]MDQ9019958.1 heavy metal sensor histidine kinase [Acinetobacter sichuanensis]
MPHNLLKSLSFRITSIFAFFSLITLLCLGCTLHIFLHRHFTEQDQAVLTGKVKLIENLLEQNQNSTENLVLFLQNALIGHGNLKVHLKKVDGTLIFNNFPKELPLSVIPTHPQPQWLSWQKDHFSYMGLQSTFVPSTTHAQSNPLTLTTITIAIDNSEHSLFIQKFRSQIFLIGFIGILSLIILGWFAVYRGLQPIVRMKWVAKKISAQHLSDRLNVADMPIELQDTAAEFNLMLDRLETSLEKLTDFSSDLAHEIRTPINNLMMQTQVCLSQERSIEQYQEILFSNYEEYEHLAKMIADLLFLAKSEHQIRPKNIQMIDLKNEFQNLFDFYEAFALDKNMYFHLSGNAILLGELSMLRRAFSNLISNAIKYGTAYTAINVLIEQKQQSIEIQIQNQSIALTQNQLARLFDRFYRVDSSRQKIVEGTGLGLAITQSIVHVHHASIHASYAPPMITFHLTFPLIQDSTHATE